MNEVGAGTGGEAQAMDGRRPSFKLLGVFFDGNFSMAVAVSQLVADAGWKLRSL